MSTIKTNSSYRGVDHFEPESAREPLEQRRLRGYLEQIDYTAFAANQAILAQTPGSLDLTSLQRLAIAAATARAQWVRLALEVTEAGHAPSKEEVSALAAQRSAFEELREAYEGIRRMIERGYISYHAGA